MPLTLPAFDGIDANASAWAKHYLSPGTDVSKDWTGIPDGVSGDTYKYGNQFDFGISYADNYVYGFTAGLEMNGTDKPFRIEMNSTVLNPFSNLSDMTLWRLPLPDLPGILLFHSTIGYSLAGQTWAWIGLPIFDPNWEPSMIELGSGAYETVLSASYTINTVKYPIGNVMYEAPVTKGFADNLTGYRMAGASVTVQNTASNMYKNGTIVACTADTPLSRPFIHSTPASPLSNNHLPEAFAHTLSVTDAPIGYDTITSIKNYHKFEMKEGCYVVLHNLQGEFLFRNPEVDSIGPVYSPANVNAVTFMLLNTDSTRATPCICVVNGQDPIYIPLVYNQSQYAKYYYSDDKGHNRMLVPYPFIDPSSLSYWNSGYISFKSTDLPNTLTYTFKFNTFVECYVASNSSLKTNVTKSCRYYPAIIDYTADFYAAYDGIYTAADNDSGQVWVAFKKAVGKAVDQAIATSPYGPLYSAGKALIKDAFGSRGANRNSSNRSMSPTARRNRQRTRSAPSGLTKQKYQPDVIAKANKRFNKHLRSKNPNVPKGPAPVSYDQSIPKTGTVDFDGYTYYLSDPGEREAYIIALRKRNKASRDKRKAVKNLRKAQTTQNRNRAGTGFRGRNRGRGRGGHRGRSRGRRN